MVNPNPNHIHYLISPRRIPCTLSYQNTPLPCFTPDICSNQIQEGRHTWSRVDVSFTLGFIVQCHMHIQAVIFILSLGHAHHIQIDHTVKRKRGQFL